MYRHLKTICLKVWVANRKSLWHTLGCTYCWRNATTGKKENKQTNKQILTRNSVSLSLMIPMSLESRRFEWLSRTTILCVLSQRHRELWSRGSTSQQETSSKFAISGNERKAQAAHCLSLEVKCVTSSHSSLVRTRHVVPSICQSAENYSHSCARILVSPFNTHYKF